MEASHHDWIRTIKIARNPCIHCCEKQWQWDSTPLKNHDLWIVFSGTGVLRSSTVRLPLKAGVATLMPPGIPLTARHDPDDRLRVFSVHFSGGISSRLVSAHLPQIDLAEQIALSATDACLRNALRAELAVQWLLCMLMEAASSPAEALRDPAIEAVRRAVEQEPGRPWTLDTMAREAFLSRPQFTRRFRKATGSSPARYVIESRIRRALSLLSQTAMPVTRVAEALGYADPAYFSKQFKDETGYSPTLYASYGKSGSGPIE